MHEVQKYPRYTQGYSYQGDQMRVGLMQGKASRLRDQDVLDEDFLYDLELDLWECLLIGTKWSLVTEALRKMPNMMACTDEDWSVAKEGIRRALAEKQRERAGRFQVARTVHIEEHKEVWQSARTDI